MERLRQNHFYARRQQAGTRASCPPRLVRVLGLCLLTVPLLGLHRLYPTPRASRVLWSRLPAPASASEAARRTARQCWTRAQQAVNTERELLEDWDPTATENLDQELWRRQLTTADRSGDLKRALKWGRHAAALARTREDAYAAARLLTRLEAEAGHPQAELEEARELAALRPHDEDALVLLQRAAIDNREGGLAARMGAALRKLGSVWATANEKFQGECVEPKRRHEPLAEKLPCR
jgi:hypothetical protein